MKKVIIIIFLILLIIGCKDSGNINLALPENTIKTYYYALEKNDLDLVNRCFLEGNYEKSSLGKRWESYDIKNIKDVKRVDVEKYEQEIKSKYDNDVYQSLYQAFLENRKKYKQEGDIEIIVTNKYPKGTSRFESVDFLYLLRKINGEWKIISHTAMVDYGS